MARALWQPPVPLLFSRFCARIALTYWMNMLSLWLSLDQRRLHGLPAPKCSVKVLVLMYLGIDIGGTFTDLVLMDENGNIVTAKAPTTPGELEKGVFDAIALVAAMQDVAVELLLAKDTAFGHGTTQATNALI